MNKILLFGTVSLLYCTNVDGQKAIVLTKSNVPILPGTVHYSGASFKKAPLPRAGKNIAWDYSSLIGDSDIMQIYAPIIQTPFTNSKTVIIDTAKKESLTSADSVHEDGFYDEDNSGWYFAGNYVKGGKYSLYNYFNDSADNIVVPAQNDSVRLNILSFPDSMGAYHRYTATKSLNFVWTVKSANLDSAPSVKKNYYSITDTVAGWGTLRIPDPVQMSIAYQVLLIKRKTITIDSFFVNNQPPNPVFLLAFGMIQGKKTVDCNEYFYTTGRQSPLLVVGFGGDSTFTRPVSAMFSTDSIKPDPSNAIESATEAGSDFSLYPNPTKTGNVTCSFTKPNLDIWKLLVFNSLGEVVHAVNIDGAGKISLALDMRRSVKGLYFVNVLDENGQMAASSKLDLVK